MPKLGPSRALDKQKKAAEVLNLEQVYFCAKRACRVVNGPFCNACDRNNPPGCNMLVQNGRLYGWNDGLGCYEDLGIASAERLTKLMDVRMPEMKAEPRAPE